VHSWWLSSDKYQASKAHTFAPLDEYSADDQKRIRASSIYDNWQTYVSISESKRLRQKFLRVNRTHYGRWELDLIVLTNEGPQAAYAPPPDSWRLGFKSRRFRVFERYDRAAAKPRNDRELFRNSTLNTIAEPPSPLTLSPKGARTPKPG
jgi:hypothetical protein